MWGGHELWGTLFHNILMPWGPCLAVSPMEGRSLGPEHSCWGQEGRGRPCQQGPALLVPPAHKEQLKAFLESIALAGCEAIGCPECPHILMGPCVPSEQRGPMWLLSHQQA